MKALKKGISAVMLAGEHSTTANTTFSGWKSPGEEAHAIQFVGTGQATAYWNARG